MRERLKNKLAADLYDGVAVRGFPPALRQRAQNKLKFVMAAARLQDLAVPPGNRLEALRGDRRGLHSIRVNDQWRICFYWNGVHAEEIEVVDYH